MRSILVKGADRIELTIRSYTDRTGRTPKKKHFCRSIATSRRMINGRIKISRARARRRL